jgi:hypothetical protein
MRGLSMKAVKLLIDKQIPRCELGSVEFELPVYSFYFKGPGTAKDEFSIRLFNPLRIDGKDIYSYILEDLFDKYESANRDIREFYRRIILMLSFHHNLSELDTKNCRAFKLGSLSQSKKNFYQTFREFPKESRISILPLQEKLIYLAGENSSSTIDLISAALYQDPFIFIPKSFLDEYAEFETCILEHFLEMMINHDDHEIFLEALTRFKKDWSDNECMRFLCREAEFTFLRILDYYYKQIYRKARHFMTMAEKRLFAFLFFQRPAFMNQIVTRSAPFLSFFLEIDRNTQIKLILLVFFKNDSIEVFQNDNTYLGKLWRAYLRLQRPLSFVPLINN